jgi:hypothetical protein
MKAQQVKNALIVPMGAKGGFVVKRNRPKSAGLPPTAPKAFRMLPDLYPGASRYHRQPEGEQNRSAGKCRAP